MGNTINITAIRYKVAKVAKGVTEPCRKYYGRFY